MDSWICGHQLFISYQNSSKSLQLKFGYRNEAVTLFCADAIVRGRLPVGHCSDCVDNGGFMCSL